MTADEQDAAGVVAAPEKKSFWQRRVVALIVAQLKQGITPREIALTIALSISLGVFPILGTTTALCLIAGVWFKLNQPIMQFINWLMYGLQLVLIVVFVRIGEWIVRADRVPISIPAMMRLFRDSPKKFFQEFGMTGLHGIVGWLAVVPFLIPLLYFCVLPPLKKLAAVHSSSPQHAG